MGKASSAKKVARAARAGGSRRSGQRRPLGFPATIGVVLVVGLLVVLFARERRNADAFPRANKDHVHSSIDIYTCIEDKAATAAATTTTTAPASSPPGSASSAPASASAAQESTTSTTATTTTSAPTPSSILQPNDVPGQYRPAPKDAHQDTLGIHTHGDGLMHIHPFADSVAGRNATLGVFLDQVGISMTDTKLTLADGTSFTKGTTKCQGGKDGIVQVAKWDHASDAAKGDKPNQIFTSGFDKIRLSANESFVIAFMPDGSAIKAKPDVEQRISNVSDVNPTTTTTAPSSASGSAPPASGQGSSTTAPPGGSSSAAP